MTVTIRDYAPGDAEALAALLRELLPCLVSMPEGAHAQVTAAPPGRRYRALLAEDDGRNVGSAGSVPSRTPPTRG